MTTLLYVRNVAAYYCTHNVTTPKQLLYRTPVSVRTMNPWPGRADAGGRAYHYNETCVEPISVFRRADTKKRGKQIVRVLVHPHPWLGCVECGGSGL